MSIASDLADALGHDMTRGTEMRDAVDPIGRSYRWVDVGEQAHLINVFPDGSSIVVVTHRDGHLTWFSPDSEARAAVSATAAELSRLRVERDRLAGTVGVRDRELAAFEQLLREAIGLMPNDSDERRRWANRAASALRKAGRG